MRYERRRRGGLVLSKFERSFARRPMQPFQYGQSVEPKSPFGEWILWAERQADRLDPLKESPPSIIDEIP
jgi:hypothetical protein